MDEVVDAGSVGLSDDTKTDLGYSRDRQAGMGIETDSTDSITGYSYVDTARNPLLW